jgi:hypothetical protein
MPFVPEAQEQPLTILFVKKKTPLTILDLLFIGWMVPARQGISLW